MGTCFEVFLRGDDELHLEAVAVAVSEEVRRLDAVLSRFNPSSEIARLNREAGQRPVRVDREVFALLARCERARELTNGYFDVTAATGGKGLLLNAQSCTVQFTHPAVALDLGAVGKGYALDCGGEILARFGVASGLVQGGTSSVLAQGAGAWPIELRHPWQPEAAPLERVLLSNCGFSCSASRHPTQAQSDIINPWFGQALDGDDACVVLAATATEAEIYSTALLAMGKQKALQYLNQHIASVLSVTWIEETGSGLHVTRRSLH
jgi:FAD:protein FMN transferase